MDHVRETPDEECLDSSQHTTTRSSESDVVDFYCATLCVSAVIRISNGTTLNDLD